MLTTLAIGLGLGLGLSRAGRSDSSGGHVPPEDGGNEDGIPENALTIDGQAITIDGEILTID